MPRSSTGQSLTSRWPGGSRLTCVASGAPVRFALAASPSRIIGLYVGRHLKLFVVPAVIAVPVAWAVMHQMEQYMAPLELHPLPPFLVVTGILMGSVC